MIAAALARWGDLASGIGDDCALLDIPAGRRLVLSVDTSVEGVHFRRAWLTAAEIGYRATTAALSDLAAMGAQPGGVAIAVVLPASWRGEFLALCDGIGEAARTAGAPIVGGDLSRGAELSLALTVVGHVGVPLMRRGARAGDELWVTGRLGGPGAAVTAWESGTEPSTADRARFAHPVARLAAAQWLVANGATAGIDISDGVVADAGHLAAASGVQMIIDLEKLPVVDGVSVEQAAHSGEEYELLITAPPTFDHAAFTAACGLPLTRIGRVTAPAPGRRAVETLHHGAHVDVPRGSDHFPEP